MPNNQPIRKRLLAQVHFAPNGCWEWTGSKHDYGYGLMIVKGRRFTTHRLSFAEFNGPLSDDDVVCHRCDNPKCINPEHLFKGTRLENNQDSKAKGRNARGERSGVSKLTDTDVISIRAASDAGALQKDLAKQYGVHENMIYYIRSRKNWKHI